MGLMIRFIKGLDMSRQNEIIPNSRPLSRADISRGFIGDDQIIIQELLLFLLLLLLLSQSNVLTSRSKVRWFKPG